MNENLAEGLNNIAKAIESIKELLEEKNKTTEHLQTYTILWKSGASCLVYGVSFDDALTSKYPKYYKKDIYAFSLGDVRDKYEYVTENEQWIRKES